MEDIVKKGGSSSGNSGFEGLTSNNKHLAELKRAYQEVVEFEKEMYEEYTKRNPKYKHSLDYVLGEFDCFYQSVFLLTAIADTSFSREEIGVIKALTDYADVFNDKDIQVFANLNEATFKEIVERCKQHVFNVPELIKIIVELDKGEDIVPNKISSLLIHITNSFLVFAAIDDAGREGFQAEISFFNTSLQKVFEYAELHGVPVLCEEEVEIELERRRDAGSLNSAAVTANDVITISDMEELKAHAEKTVVYIEAYSSEGSGSGSGFIISPDGYAVTAAHVVRGAEEIRVRIRPNGNNGPSIFAAAKVVVALKHADMALIKIDAVGLSYLSMLEESKDAEPGEPIYLIGYPLGAMVSDNRNVLNYTMTQGNVSAKQHKNGYDLTLIDILAVQGNSGGPIISAKTGQVVGILLGAFVAGSAPVVYMRPIKYVWQRFLVK